MEEKGKEVESKDGRQWGIKRPSKERVRQGECLTFPCHFPEGNRSSAFHALRLADKQSQLYLQHVEQLNGCSVWAGGWSLPSEGGRATDYLAKPQCPFKLLHSQTKHMLVLGGPEGQRVQKMLWKQMGRQGPRASIQWNAASKDHKWRINAEIWAFLFLH